MRRAFGKFTDFVSNNCKTTTMFASTGCFNGSIKSKQVRLVSNLIDDFNDLTDLFTATTKFFNDRGALSDGLFNFFHTCGSLLHNFATFACTITGILGTLGNFRCIACHIADSVGHLFDGSGNVHRH